MDEAQAARFETWVASDEAIHLIGGEDRNHIDTAWVAFVAGWNAALERVNAVAHLKGKSDARS